MWQHQTYSPYSLPLRVAKPYNMMPLFLSSWVFFSIHKFSVVEDVSNLLEVIVQPRILKIHRCCSSGEKMPSVFACHSKTWQPRCEGCHLWVTPDETRQSRTSFAAKYCTCSYEVVITHKTNHVIMYLRAWSSMRLCVKNIFKEFKHISAESLLNFVSYNTRFCFGTRSHLNYLCKSLISIGPTMGIIRKY